MQDARLHPAGDAGSSLLSAAALGNTEAASRFLESGASPDEATPTGTTALMKAARAGQTAIVDCLLYHGARVNERDGTHGTTALMLACATGKEACVASLLAASACRADRDDEGRSAMLYAARGGYTCAHT